MKMIHVRAHGGHTHAANLDITKIWSGLGSQRMIPRIVIKLKIVSIEPTEAKETQINSS
jgi:hypothetical protein